MTIILGILAIILAILALIPYGLEMWFWHYKRPKIHATIANQVIRNSGTNEVDIQFWLGVKLTRGSPAYIRELRLVLPLDAKPYPHPQTREAFRQEGYTDGPGLRRALVLNVPLPHRALSAQYSHVYMIALHVPKEQDRMNLELVAEIETDEARLGFWAIFHHARHYLQTIPIELQLDQPKNQEFIG